MYLIKNVTIFDGIKLVNNKSVLIANGKILDVIDADSTSPHKVKEEIEGRDHILAPGFIDIQVNGGGGFIFDGATDVQSLKKIHDTHLQFGTTSILPTLISDSFLNTKNALNRVKEAIKQNIPGILGIHLEGPYLNPEKNGIHNKKNLHLPTQAEIDAICEFDLPIKLVTLAPEIVSRNFMEQLHKNKVLIFAGHTQATFKQMQGAIQYGVSGITHFFNACSPFSSREPGVVGAGLFYDDIWCGLIADGYHVSYESIKIAFKTKTTDRFILVSDAMSPVGTKINEFTLHEQKIYVQGNKYMDKQGTLAGSSLTMYQAFKNIVEQNCASLEKALAMTSTNVAKCLHLDQVKGKVCANYDADLVLLKKDSLELRLVIQAGVIV